MGGAACKVVIDYYGAVTAEANAIIAGDFPLRLKEEAALLGTSIEAMCDTFQLAKEYIEEEGQTQSVIDISYEACDWAKAMRKMRDTLRGHEGGAGKADASCANLRAWRDKIVAFYTAIAEHEMREDGYTIPAIDANGRYPVTP